jgi:hypothetical protein
MIKKQKLLLIDFLVVLVTLLADENLSKKIRVKLVAMIMGFILLKIYSDKEVILEPTEVSHYYVKLFVTSFQNSFLNSSLIKLLNNNIIQNLKEFKHLGFFLVNF